MDTQRFLSFIQSIEAVQKEIQRIKWRYAPTVGVKGVHLVWLCELLGHPDGLTPSTLAKRTGVDRSLVSRELNDLLRDGYVVCVSPLQKRNYNVPICLTEKGTALAKYLVDEAMEIQQMTDIGILKEELAVFYRVLHAITDNLSQVNDESEPLPRTAEYVAEVEESL